jgi:hypothetical protein
VSTTFSSARGENFLLEGQILKTLKYGRLEGQILETLTISSLNLPLLYSDRVLEKEDS